MVRAESVSELLSGPWSQFQRILYGVIIFLFEPAEITTAVQPPGLSAEVAFDLDLDRDVTRVANLYLERSDFVPALNVSVPVEAE